MSPDALFESGSARALPTHFTGVGYTRSRDSLPLEAIAVAVPTPGADQVLIRVIGSSLNPLDYKLAELNFLGRTPPVVLGFDLSGIVVAVGRDVTHVKTGDAVMALVDGNVDGGWGTGGEGYALARSHLTVLKPERLSFRDAGVLPIVFVAAYLGLNDVVKPGDTVYIPAGGGGVGHLAIQMAKRIYGAKQVISSAGTPQTMDLARRSGADHILNYKTDDLDAEIARLTGGAGVDVAFDVTYNEASFVHTAGAVRDAGTWVVLGVGPGKTTRTSTTQSPVAAILAAKGARDLNANMLRYYTEPATLTDDAKALLRTAMTKGAEWAASGQVVPHIGKVIPSDVEAINREVLAMKAGGAVIGKVAVTVDASRE